MNVAVVGAGAFGTALANQLARCGNQVKIWAYEVELVDQINKLHENQMYLAGVNLFESILASNDLEEVYKFSDYIFLAPPFFALSKILPEKADNKIFVCASKGIERETGKLAFEIVKENVAGSFEVVVLSGASFAREVAQGLPTKVAVASKSPQTAQKIGRLIGSNNFKVEYSDDLVGVELAGATKNVLAIVLGMATGCDFGKNFKAALFTQGLFEMIILGEAMGAKKETFETIAGLGDLYLTATSEESRNFIFGLNLAKGGKADELLESKNVVEGAATAESAYRLAKKHGLNLPIFENVYEVIYQRKDLKRALEDIWKNI